MPPPLAPSPVLLTAPAAIERDRVGAAQGAARAWRAWGGVTLLAALAACGGGSEVERSPAAADQERLRPMMATPAQGTWSAPLDLGFAPAAAANVPAGTGEGAGRVVMWSAENRFSFGAQGETAPAIQTWVSSYDALTNTATAPRQDVTGHNMFCPGTVNLPDGRLMVTGGSTSRVTSIFDPATNVWSRAPGSVMAIPRAYHANAPLRDGSVFMLGGSWNGGVGGKDGEVWNPSTGWRRLAGVPVAPFQTADSGGPYRSDNHMWLLPMGNGRVLHAGPSANMNWIDTRGSGSVASAGRRGDDADAMQGSIAMYEPGRVLITGGAREYVSSVATNSAFVLDATGELAVSRIDGMAFSRVFHNSVVLPNGQVMVIGGKDQSVAFNDAGARLIPELWDPSTRRFTQLPAMQVPRTYHSFALLLPDARVMAAGGGLCNCAADQPRMQVYTPHYLLNADGSLATRPRITAAPAQVEFGASLTVTTDAAVTSFVLVRLSSVTHTVNNDQRRIPLTIRATSGTTYSVDAPTNPGWAVPGSYMLFALDARGVPSLARTVRLGLGTAPLVDPLADQTSAANSAITAINVTAPAMAGLTFAATGLPTGLSINAATGAITGTPTAAGTWRVTVEARNPSGATSTELLWRISGPPGPIPTSARFVRLEQLSEVNGNPWGSMAEFNLLTPAGALIPRTGWVASASSVELAGESGAAANAIDGNVATIWHTQWQAANPPPPHNFVVNLGAVQSIGGFRYLPRPAGSSNGTIATYRLYFSDDGVNWGSPVTAGNLSNVAEAADRSRTVMFNAAPPPTNRPPTLATPAAQTSAAGVSVSLGLAGTDPDGDALTYAATGLPPGLTLTTGSGAISGVATTPGNYAVNASVADGRGGSAAATFSWTITSAAAPTIQPIQARPAAPGASVTYTVSATGAGLSYAWSFGDGTPQTAFGTSASVTRSFANPGLYTVTAFVRAVDGTTSTRSFTQAIATAPTAARPRASSPIAFEARTGSPSRWWVVNPDNNSVSVFDAANNSRLAEVAVGSAPQSVAVAPNGWVWVVNRDSASISIFQGALTVGQTLALPRASQPYGITFGPDGRAYVALSATGEVLRINADRTLGTRTAVGADVRELSITSDGTRLFASRFITPPLPGEGTAVVDVSPTRGAEVVVLTVSTLAVQNRVVLRHSEKPDTTAQGRGIPNYLGAAVVAPDGRSAWVPSKQDNIRRGTLRDGNNLDFQNTVRAISSRIDLANLAAPVEDHPARIDHDNASLASAAAFHPSGAYLFVALETSRQLAVVDPVGRRELFRVPVGRAPQGLTVSTDGTRLYVSNFMDRSVSVFDLDRLVNFGEPSLPVLATVPTITTERLGATVLNGKQLFYDALDRRLSRDAYMSCASCHRDGSHDGRVWDLTGLGEGLRNTLELRGRAGLGHGALHWSGNFDEVQDFEAQIRTLAGGTGLMSDAQFNTGTRNQPLGDRKAGISADLDALAAYVGSLDTFVPSPRRDAIGSMTVSATAGRTLFQNMNCASCHGGATFTGSTLTARLSDIGTLKASSGTRLGAPLTGLDAPTLRDVWASAPYLHDGSAPTVEAAIRAHTGPGVQNAAAIAALTATELGHLADYVRQIGSEEPTAPAPTSVPLTNLALGKVATQSSTLWGAVPSIAVDGRTGGNGRAGPNITHTGNAPNEWWQVDLGSSMAIGSVVLWNRTDCCSNRLSNFVVFVSQTDMTGRSFAALQADSTIWRSAFPGTVGTSQGIPVNASGRYVRVQLAGANFLSLAELQVFGAAGSLPSNQAPVVQAVAAQSSAPGQPVTLAMQASDADNDPLSWAATGLPPGLVIDPATGVISGAVDAGAAPGLRQVTVTASDLRTPPLTGRASFGWSVVAAPAATNLALGKPAQQSSTEWNAGPQIAVDGVINGTATAGPFLTATGNAPHEWWQTDLGAVSSIRSIVLWGRTDCCSERLGNFHVFVSSTDMTGRTHASLVADPAVWKLLVTDPVWTSRTITVNATGRHVRIQMAVSEYLELSEVQVFGTAP
jgi:large repetitive protein